MYILIAIIKININNNNFIYLVIYNLFYKIKINKLYLRAKKWTQIEPMIKLIIFKQIKLMKVKINISKAMGWHNIKKDNNILKIRNSKKIGILNIHVKMINLIINLDKGKKIFYIFFSNYLT